MDRKTDRRKQGQTVRRTDRQTDKHTAGPNLLQLKGEQEALILGCSPKSFQAAR